MKENCLQIFENFVVYVRRSKFTETLQILQPPDVVRKLKKRHAFWLPAVIGVRNLMICCNCDNDYFQYCTSNSKFFLNYEFITKYFQLYNDNTNIFCIITVILHNSNIIKLASYAVKHQVASTMHRIIKKACGFSFHIL